MALALEHTPDVRMALARRMSGVCSRARAILTSMPDLHSACSFAASKGY